MWQLTPIHVATQHCIRKGMMDKGDPSDATERMDIPFVCWLLRHSEHSDMYLVDCGPDLDNTVNAGLHQPMTMLESWHIRERLSAMGVAPEKITAIIATHLHWDHLKAIGDLPDSLPILVQRTELAYAASSKGRPYGKPYETDVQELPYFLKCYNQYKFLDGDTEITPGLKVIPLPGHTAGSQAVLVETDKGNVVLANDLINVLENWTDGILPGNIADFSAWQNSFELLKEYERSGWTIVPGHDFRIFHELKPLFESVFPPFD